MHAKASAREPSRCRRSASRGRVTHCGKFARFEEEMMALGIGEAEAGLDRADALVLGADSSPRFPATAGAEDRPALASMSEESAKLSLALTILPQREARPAPHVRINTQR